MACLLKITFLQSSSIKILTWLVETSAGTGSAVVSGTWSVESTLEGEGCSPSPCFSVVSSSAESG